MAVHYLKKADKTAATGEQDVAATVQAILDDIESGGEAKAVEYSRKFDRWDGETVVSEAAIKQAAEKVPDQLKDDIRFAHDRVRRFAEAQRASLTEFETELSPGLWAGQKLIPMQAAG